MTHAAVRPAGTVAAPFPRGAEPPVSGLLQTRCRLEAASAALHVTMSPDGPARAGIELLEDVLRVGAAVRAMNGGSGHTRGRPVRFVVLEGPSGDMFGLGGDLYLLADAVEAGDVATLRRFAYTASDVCHALSDGFGAGVVTISHVCGNALGGAFEAARSCDLLVAEENAVFSLPEADFDFVPGAGTMTAILPRIGQKAVRELVLGGGRISARRALELDLVDRVAPVGEGAEAVANVIATVAPRHGNAVATFRGIAASCGLTKEKFRAEADRWVATASTLPPASVARMRRLGAIQDASHRRKRQGSMPCH